MLLVIIFVKSVPDQSFFPIPYLSIHQLLSTAFDLSQLWDQVVPKEQVFYWTLRQQHFRSAIFVKP